MPGWRSGAEPVALERNQSNYLGNVLRLSAGDTILAVQGTRGEWQASLPAAKRLDPSRYSGPDPGRRIVCPTSLTCLRRSTARLDYMVQRTRWRWEIVPERF